MTKEQFRAWKSLEETERFFEVLKLRQEELKEHWSRGGFINDIRAEDRALGEIACIAGLFELTEEEFPNE